MTPISDDITPVCEQPPRARKKSDRRQPASCPRDLRKSPIPQILLQKKSTARGREATVELLWQQIAAAWDRNIGASAGTSVPSGCELPHCHHASSLGPYRG